MAQNEANRSIEFELGRVFSIEDATLAKDLLATRAILGLALHDLSADHTARVASSYLSTAELVGVLGEYYGFVPIFFWQPSLHATQKPLTPYEQSLMRAIDSDAFHVAGKEILTRLRNSIGADAASRSLTGFRDISGVFDDRTETVFVDNGGHTTEAANELVVGSMIESVIEALEAAEARSSGLSSRSRPRFRKTPVR